MMPTILRSRTLLLGTMLGAVLLAPSAADANAKITIINADGPGEGFNDPTPVAPVGGNPGTTRGEQRQIAFQYAANLWAATIDSNVEIYVQATFDALGPNVLGSAGPTFVFSDFPATGAFPGPEFANTWYVSALADKRAGTDLLQLEGFPPGVPDIVARFSSDFPFYLGLDNNHGPQNDLVVVVQHELGHGLGFLTLLNRQTGAFFFGLPDIFTHYTYDGEANVRWIDFATDQQRAESVLNVDHVAWDGPTATAAVPSVLSFGRPELSFSTPPSLGSSIRVGTASFGPPLTVGGVTGNVVIARGGPPPTSEACTPVNNAAEIAGNIALVDRGTCTFVTKVLNAQAAGAIAVLVADNVAGSPPPGLGGSDPSVVIPSVRITMEQGDAIKAALKKKGSVVTATLALDNTRIAGALQSGQPQLYATDPIQAGSSISHWDSIASPNLLMEPAINPDLTHQLIPPYDLTLVHFRDLGWFLDGNLDGVEDTTVFLAGCDTGTPNVLLSNGATLADQARAWYAMCSTGRNPGQVTSCLSALASDAVADGLISSAQKDALMSCSTAGTQ
jgi:hypothetical protein